MGLGPHRKIHTVSKFPAPLTQLLKRSQKDLKSILLKGVNSLITKNLDKSQRQIKKLKITVGKGISSWQQI